MAHHRREKANFDMLQEQIQPHFLYNCIDSINWMATRQKAYDAAKMARLLGRFYRLILSKGSQVIPLRDELEHVKVFLEIMQMRLDCRLTVDWEVDETLLDVMIVKLILQPIVENAILHGLMHSASDEGQLFISITKKRDRIKMSVEDNGIGMEKTSLLKLREGIQSETSAGFGLRNVNQRLKMYYGPSCGVEIESKPGSGTKVSLYTGLTEVS
jgi:two-component system sensor histidine kinase YesM